MQTIYVTKKYAEDIEINILDSIVSPPSSGQTTEFFIGSVTQGSFPEVSFDASSTALRKIFNFVLAKGDKGEPGTVAGLATIKNIFNVLAYGAKGDGIADDTVAFQSCINAAIAARGKIVVPSPNTGFYKITNTIQVLPLPGVNQVWCDLDAWGLWDSIKYMGPSNRPVFKIIGLKQSVWSGLKIGIAPGLTGVQVFDIDTTELANSTSFNTFKNCNFHLGDQANNVGYRLGHISGGNADISNYQWENCTVFGTNKPGQIAYLVEGRNTLSQTWSGGFVAFCDRIFSNKSGAGATTERGNGSVYFFGLGGSQNTVDFEFTFEQTYLISGGRFEAGKRFLNVPLHSLSMQVTVQNAQINDYSPADGTLMYFGTAGKLIVDNCTMNRNDGEFTRMIVLDGTGGKGTLHVRAGNASSPKPFYHKQGSAQWRVYIEGVGKSTDGHGVFSSDWFDDERPPFKTN